MAQSDQTVQNATFPTVRADINDNLAALFSQSSGNSAPATTVAFQPWIDTSSSPAVWKVRNGTNSGWITVGTFDTTTFTAGGLVPIASGGTGQTTASNAINALVPSQAGNADKFLKTNGSLVSWAAAAAGASLQVFTSSGTYTPTTGKTSFLVFATGGGGGGGQVVNGSSGVVGAGGGGGGGGTAMRMYNSAEMGGSASITIGGGGGSSASGGNTSFSPGGTGLTITGNGGSSGGSANNSNAALAGGTGGATSNTQLSIDGGTGGVGSVFTGTATGGSGGTSFLSGGYGDGGNGAGRTTTGTTLGSSGSAGAVFVLEF